MHYLIFDFDGVLGDTLDQLVKINAAVDGTDEIISRNKLLSFCNSKLHTAQVNHP